MTPVEEYEQYEILHRDFSKAYAQVYKHVMDFYPQPQKFIQEATPEIDTYVEKLSATANKQDEEGSFQALFYFAKNFKAFAAEANDVFEEYKGLQGESGSYIKSVFRLKEKNPGNYSGAAEFTKLVPVLNKLIGGFRRIEQKTEENAKAFRQLQNEWRRLKANIGPEKKGTAWPL
jgi:hypothetical protein